VNLIQKTNNNFLNDHEPNKLGTSVQQIGVGELMSVFRLARGDPEYREFRVIGVEFPEH